MVPPLPSFVRLPGLPEDPLAPARAALADAFRRTLGAPSSDELERRRAARAADPDPGLFGPDSVAWRVHGELATLVGGLRALLLQTLHPLAMAGVAEHSAYREDPFGRLHRTATFLGDTVFGTTAQAEQAIAAVRRIHVRVTGTAPDGRPYSATDPHLVTFVHVTEVDSFLAAHQRYSGRSLRRSEADRYVGEMAAIARRLGGEEVPTTVRELRAWLDGVRPELEVGEQARDAVRFILDPPLPLLAKPTYALVDAAAIGLLPAWAQWMLRLPSLPPVDLLAVRPAMRSLLGVLGWALGPAPPKAGARARVAGSSGPSGPRPRR